MEHLFYQRENIAKIRHQYHVPSVDFDTGLPNSHHDKGTFSTPFNPNIVIIYCGYV